MAFLTQNNKNFVIQEALIVAPLFLHCRLMLGHLELGLTPKRFLFGTLFLDNRAFLAKKWVFNTTIFSWHGLNIDHQEFSINQYIDTNVQFYGL